MTTTQTQNEFRGNDKLLIGMVLGVLTFWLFYQSMFNVVPSIQKDLGMSDTSLNAVISLGSLFSGCFIILMGGLADKFGRVRLTYVGFTLNIIACLVLYFSTNPFTFGLGRVLQGLSSACIMPATLSIIKNYYHGAERQRAFSFGRLGRSVVQGFRLLSVGQSPRAWAGKAFSCCQSPFRWSVCFSSKARQRANRTRFLPVVMTMWGCLAV